MSSEIVYEHYIGLSEQGRWTWKVMFGAQFRNGLRPDRWVHVRAGTAHTRLGARAAVRRAVWRDKRLRTNERW